MKFLTEPIVKPAGSEKSMILASSRQDQHAGPGAGDENILRRVDEPPPRRGTTKGRFCAPTGLTIGSVVNVPDKRKKADVLVVPIFKIKDKLKWPTPFDSTTISTLDFKGKAEEISLQYVTGSLEPRVILLGLGEAESITVESLRRAYAAVCKAVNGHKLKTVNLLVPKIPDFAEEDILRGIAEGFLLANYAYRGQKKESETTSLVNHICFITPAKNALKIVEKAITICEGVTFARDLVNGNADDVTPQFLAETTLALSKRFPKVKATIFDKKRLQKEGFGLILAVSQGSHVSPVMIVAEYKGNPKDKKTTVLVGKGVTYDTGGLNLKPTGSMETMKCDMGGAAAVLAILQVAASLELKHNITVVIPSVENSISATSYKPGDVYKGYSGKTVEIGNTDAEGRLILADALAYAVKHLHPKQIIDVATLTGAIEIALGSECAGLFCNNDVLADAILRSGRITFERVWRMPIFDEYREKLDSDVADLKNHGGRSGGACVAAIFLKEFIEGDIPWAHLDIAATAYLGEKKRYQPKYATGMGVRLLIEVIENLP